MDQKDIERFEQKYRIEPETDCWIWVDHNNGDGYGRFRLGGKMVSAHRLSHIIYIGEIPDNMEVCHKCDNPGCVNPDHLWLGTHADNMHDRDKKGRSPNAYGEENHNAKLTETNVLEIRRLYATGDYTQKQLGQLFGVSQSTVFTVISRKRWQDDHITLGEV